MIDNWIIWLPKGNYTSPQNIRTVWSRGFESSLKLERKSGPVQTRLTLLYNYVIATNEKTTGINDSSLFRQLIYVPLYSYQANISLSYKSWNISYVHTYTGNRFTSSDNSEYVEGYQLGNFKLNKTIVIKHLKCNLNLQVNNAWNKVYQVFPLQAMPLRSYQAGISVFFHKSDN